MRIGQMDDAELLRRNKELGAKQAGEGVASDETSKPKSETRAFNPEKEVASFMVGFGLENFAVGPEFASLSAEQKLLVVRTLKNRIIDIVKEDARTQYSEEITKRMAGRGKIKKFFGGLWDSAKKEFDLKNIEAKILKSGIEKGELQELVKDDFIQLTRMTKERDVRVEDGKPVITFLDPLKYPPEHRKAIDNFNAAANNFRETPYEWGQEQKTAKLNWEITKTHRTKYDRAKSEYEKARNEILKIKIAELGTEKGLTEVLEFDKVIQIEQLLNTHPEVANAFDDLSEGAGAMELMKTGGNLLRTITGGKNTTNKVLFLGGMGLRAATASITLGLAVPWVGAVIGRYRAKALGQQTLGERKMEARHGKKDASKEKVLMTDSTTLKRQLEKLIKGVYTASSPGEKAKQISLLNLRIEHTKGKMEKGLVNFGDARSIQVNQFELIDALNYALVLSESETLEADVDFKKRIDKLLASSAKYAGQKTSEAQKEFLRIKMRQGAYYGALFATVGYGVRFAGEQLGWWGQNAQIDYEREAGERAAAHSSIQIQAALEEQTKIEPEVVDIRDIRYIPGTLERMSPVGADGSTAVPDSASASGAPGAGGPEPAPNAGVVRAPEAGPVPSGASGTPESIIPETVIHRGEGIEHAFIRQIEHNPQLQTELGFKPGDDLHSFAQRQAHLLAIRTGYVDGAGGEVRVLMPDKVAYEIKMSGGHITGVEERMIADGSVTETHDLGATFEQSGVRESYEYPRGSGSNLTARPGVTETGLPPAPGMPNIEPGDLGAVPGGESADAVRPFETSPRATIGEHGLNNRIPFTEGGSGRPGASFRSYDTENLVPDSDPAVRGAPVNPEDTRAPRVLGNRTFTQQSGVTLDQYGSPRSGMPRGGGGRTWTEPSGVRFQSNNPYQNFGGYRSYGFSRPANIFSEMGNPHGLPGANLDHINTVFYSAVHDIFPTDTEMAWRDYGLRKAAEMINTPSGEIAEDGPMRRLVSYLNEVRRETGVRPHDGSIFRKAESVEHYLVRALQSVARRPETLERLRNVG